MSQLFSGDASPERVFLRADKPIKTLTFASEIRQAALVLGPSPEGSVGVRTYEQGPKREPFQRLI
jgi:hypothetical protein